MAMRTGKTKTTIDDFGEMELAGEVKDLLVLAPAGVYRTWEDQFEEHASEDLNERALVHVWETKGGSAHDEALRNFWHSATTTTTTDREFCWRTSRQPARWSGSGTASRSS
jgi:hypothetical protein